MIDNIHTPWKQDVFSAWGHDARWRDRVEGRVYELVLQKPRPLAPPAPDAGAAAAAGGGGGGDGEEDGGAGAGGGSRGRKQRGSVGMSRSGAKRHPFAS